MVRISEINGKIIVKGDEKFLLPTATATIILGEIY